jgi:hypothetical protein
MNFGYVLNTLPTIVDISKKLFDTYKKDFSNSGSNKDVTVSQKIYELENSMLQQADLLNKLAEQVKSMADELNRQKKLLYFSLTVSVVAVIVAVVAVVGK